MPRKRKTPDSPRDRLARLSILPDLVFEGGARLMRVPLADSHDFPWAILWVDAASGYVRASGVVEAEDDGSLPEAEVASIFAGACAEPITTGEEIPPNLVSLPGKAGGRAKARAGSPGAQRLRTGLPALVRMEPGAMEPLIRALVEPLGVRVEVVEQPGAMPGYEEASASLTDYLARSLGGPSEPFAWDIPQEVIAPLMKAAGGLWRRAPWDYMPDHPPVAIELGQRGLDSKSPTLYASIMGGGGIVEGVALYFSAKGFHDSLRQGAQVEAVDEDVDHLLDLLRRSGAPVEGVPDELLRGLAANMLVQSGATEAEALTPQQDSLAVLYGPAAEEDPSYMEWLTARGLKAASRDGVPYFVRTEGGAKPRPPTEREARALALALDALNQFFSKHARALSGPFISAEPLTLQARVETGAGPVAIPVAFPPPNWDFAADMEAMGMDEQGAEDEGDAESLQPASLEGMRTVYRFLVKLQHKQDVWRRIEMRGDQTLDDLHYAIQDAFDWDNDHLYAFYLSGKAWDTDTEYMDPEGEGEGFNAAAHRLEHLPLRPRQRILYIFDFGDELRHSITLEAITPSGVTPGATYPRVTEQHGKNVPQYPDVDAEMEEDKNRDTDQ